MSRVVIKVTPPYNGGRSIHTVIDTEEGIKTEDLGGSKYYTKLLIRYGTSHHLQLDGVPRGGDSIYAGLFEAGVTPALDTEAALRRLIKANVGTLIRNLDKVTGFLLFSVDRSTVITNDRVRYPNCNHVALERFKGMVIALHENARNVRYDEVRLGDKVSFKSKEDTILEGGILMISRKGALIECKVNPYEFKNYFVRWCDVMKLLNDKDLTSFDAEEV